MARSVIVIDEVRDILRVCGEKTETNLGHLTQFGYAAGIHVIVSTQVPSFFRIGGHFRSRIAFRLPDAKESKAALNQAGAENLGRYGDMLYLPADSMEPEKVRCCFVSAEEIACAVRQARDAAGGTELV